MSKCECVPIAIDTREQRPFTFRDIKTHRGIAISRIAMSEGDYGIVTLGDVPPRDLAIVERKSLSDLYGSVTQGRKRFEQEFIRIRDVGYGYAAVVIESDIAAILNPEPFLKRGTLANPKAVLLTISAWSQRYGVHIWPCPSRRVAEILTFRILERWAEDHGLIVKRELEVKAIDSRRA